VTIAEVQTWPTVAMTARLLGVTPCRVRQLAASGRLEVEWTPLGRLINPASIERFKVERAAMKERRREAAA